MQTSPSGDLTPVQLNRRRVRLPSLRLLVHPVGIVQFMTNSGPMLFLFSLLACKLMVVRTSELMVVWCPDLLWSTISVFCFRLWLGCGVPIFWLLQVVRVSVLPSSD